jgi:alpha-glucosidase
MNPSSNLKYFSRFERVSQVERTARGILAHVEGELLRVDVIRDDIVRVKISRGRQFDESPTYAVCADLEAEPPTFEVEETKNEVRLITACLTMTIGKSPFRLDAHRADGSAIFETYQDEDDDCWAYATLNDHWMVRRRCRTEDAFFGLGEKTGRFNRRGRDFSLWNVDVLNPNASGAFSASLDKGDPRASTTSTEFDPYYVSIPFFYHQTHDHLGGGNSPMAGLFVDNGYCGRFDFSEPGEYSFHFEGGQYTEYIFAAPAMRGILEAYTHLTGRMAAPPLWALGYHQCRWFRYTQEAVEKLAKRHRERNIPCDVMWLDIEYMDGYRVFTWNDKTFPDPKKMLARLKDQGFRAITIIDPGVKVEPGYAVFDEAVERDVLCKTESGDLYIGEVWPGRTAFPDFVTKEARDWWGQLNAQHVEFGLAGIWNDMNEPATGDIPCEAMRFGGGEYSHARYHNQYALLMAMGTVDGLRRAMPDKRTFVLSRAGSPGIQRYAANWMGDNCSRWDHLWLSLPMALGFGVSGQPFLGADIGGFAEHSDAELFLRWMQYGVLTPFCRNHSNMGNVDQYAWSFGKVIENLCREAIELRYRLMPYIYAAFMQSTQTGEPLQKPLVFDFQDDLTVREIDDEYLFGSDLLVAPVCKAGTTARQVYLPAGTWFDWHTGEKHAGERFLLAATPMEYIPLYARGGAVVPMWPEAPPSTADYHPDSIELHIFLPDGDGEYSSFLHEDDGLSFGFQSGAYLQTDFVLTKTGAQLSLEATVSGQGFPEFARREFHIQFHGAACTTVQVNGEDLAPQSGRFVLANTGTKFHLRAQMP